jgi:hypothetical protein
MVLLVVEGRSGFGGTCLQDRRCGESEGWWVVDGRWGELEGDEGWKMRELEGDEGWKMRELEGDEGWKMRGGGRP